MSRLDPRYCDYHDPSGFRACGKPATHDVVWNDRRGKSHEFSVCDEHADPKFHGDDDVITARAVQRPGTVTERTDGSER